MTVAGYVLAVIAAYVLMAVVVVAVLRCAKPSPYPPEAAEAPDIVEEAYVENGDTFGFERARPLTEAGPFVVAGSDLDRAHQPMSLVNLTLRLMVDADSDLSAMSARAETLAGLYVAPEVDR